MIVNPTPLIPPLEGAKLVLGTIAVALATFMNVLDSSIANVAIPTISGNLGVSVDRGHVGDHARSRPPMRSAMPLTGWLTQRVGQVRLFVSSIVLFVLSSWLCGSRRRCRSCSPRACCRAPSPAR